MLSVLKLGIKQNTWQLQWEDGYTSIKSWRCNIVVKLFTAIGPKSCLVNLLRNMLKIFQDIQDILTISLTSNHIFDLEPYLWLPAISLTSNHIFDYQPYLWPRTIFELEPYLLTFYNNFDLEPYIWPRTASLTRTISLNLNHIFYLDQFFLLWTIS